MLTRVESLYLAILRVVILAVATLALLVAVIAAVVTIRSLSHWHGTEITGGDLAAYIEQRKATAVAPGGTADAASNAPAPVLSYSKDVRAAANTIYTYLSPEKQPTVTEWESAIDGSAGPDILDHDTYFASVRAAADQLKTSTGKKLTLDQVQDYLAWNHSQYESNVGAQAVAKGQALAAGMLALYVTGGAFFFFILIVFVFIFVRIERSLRLVHTVRMEADHA